MVVVMLRRCSDDVCESEVELHRLSWKMKAIPVEEQVILVEERVTMVHHRR